MISINDYQLRITGAASLGQALEPDKRAKITTEVEVYEIAKRDNQDGTHNMIYKSKVVSAIDVEQSGKVFRGTGNKKASLRLRGAIYHLQNEVEQMDKDQEEFYEIVMKILIGNLANIYQQYEKKD